MQDHCRLPAAVDRLGQRRDSTAHLEIRFGFQQQPHTPTHDAVYPSTSRIVVEARHTEVEPRQVSAMGEGSRKAPGTADP